MSKKNKVSKIIKISSIIGGVLCVAAFSLGFVKTGLGSSFYLKDVTETVEVHRFEDIQKKGETVYNDKFVLMRDIHIADETFKLGTAENPFTGEFDGKGKTVFLDYTAADIKNPSLFGCIGAEGVVKNVRFVFSVIAAEGNFFAGIANVNGGIVQDCKVELKKLSFNSADGMISPCVAINRGTIKNVVTTCTLEYTGEVKSKLNVNFGAVCAYNCGTMKNCIAFPDFKGLDCVNEFSVLKGEQQNDCIASVCSVSTSGALTANCAVVLKDGVYTSDKHNAWLKVFKSKMELDNITVFNTYDFDNRVWKISDGELILSTEE